ncbi:hypothetical protein [Luteimonas saliphila]|uniref:portal protein n=1 Tax=Luteimonas saliphila TaxID=2804919 RepID=UPI00192D8FD4|nr:hypothetical protein [Luteimonas saliphila]
MALELEFQPAQRNEPFPLDNIGGLETRQAKPLRGKTAKQQEEEVISTLQSWYSDQVDAHLDNRREQILDADYYDLDQIDERTRRTLEARNQAPLTFDLTHAVVDWITGTERRTRQDWKVHPRGPEDLESAEVKTQLLKFVSDANQATWERSRAFKDAVKVGVGWVREFAQIDHDRLPVSLQHTDWKAVRWDEFSRADDLRDCRAINIDRYIDLDYGIAMFPNQAEELRRVSQQFVDAAMEYVEDDLVVPQMFHGQRIRSGTFSGSVRSDKRRRSRLKLVETEYRRVVVEKRVRALTNDYPELSNMMFDEKDPALRDYIDRKVITVDDRPVERMWVAIWVPETTIMCLHEPIPYRHGRFSLTPTWCYRRDRDGMPYGVMRGLRDPQDEYNKRRSKTLFALSTNRVMYEEDAIANGVDEEDFLAEVPKPNAQLKLASGALAGQKIKIEMGGEIAAGHITLMEGAARHMFEASGVTRENLGLDSDAKSGKAIIAKQQQGAVGTAEIFDNNRRALQISGEKTLSLTEQYVSMPMQIRVVGPEGVHFVAINQPQVDPLTGEVVFKNDILASQADFVVESQNHHETIRMAMAEQLLETIGKLDPAVGLQLLDLAIDLTDLPNRAELVARIRQINGVGQPTPEPDPAAEQAAAAEQQAQQQAADVQNRRLEAQTAKDLATADNLRAKAQQIAVQTKGEALGVAGVLQSAVHLAPAADRLAEYPPPVGTGPGAGMEPQ